MKLKKAISFLLAIALVLVMIYPICAFAVDPVVGVLTIFAIPGENISSGGGNGHAWLSFKCTTWPGIDFGGLYASINSEITIGTFGNLAQHKGIWYNVESYQCNNTYNWLARVSLSMNVTRNQVEILNNYIDQLDSWTLTRNCAHFAAMLWNAVASDQVDAGVIATPAALHNSITSYEHYEEIRPILENTTIGYVEGYIWYSCDPELIINSLSNVDQESKE